MSDSNFYAAKILQNVEQMSSETLSCNTTEDADAHKKETNNVTEHIEKASAVWTYNATLALLKLYDNNLGMLQTPKKKTRIWISISESLKDYNIEMSPDQIRWKINALTKKYKQCLDTGQPIKFKYFREMDNIYAKYNANCDTFALNDIIQKKIHNNQPNLDDLNKSFQITSESKAAIELRKVRLANRIESDRSQSKLNLEKQWLEYLKRQEQDKLLQDEVFDRNLKIREEELELYRQELEIMESLELRNLELKEREQNELLQVEREKCVMLKNFLDNKDF